MYFGGGMMLAPHASLRDGLLELVMIGDVSRRRFLTMSPTVFRGAHVRQSNVSVQRCSSVRISASRPFAVYADGDPTGDLPITVRALPRAVRAIVHTP
jgi:diacylglycerol kinase family enzyme